MWRQTLVIVVLYLLSAEYSVVMCGVWPETLLTRLWIRLSMIYCCALRLWSQICITCRRCWFPVPVALFLLCRGKMSRARGMAAYVRDGYGVFRQSKFVCDCCEMLVFRVCGVRQNLFVYSLYRNPDLDDQIFDCLIASMAAVQAEDVRASLLFVGDLNGHHQEWLGSTTTNRHGVAAFDFSTASGCD